MVDVATCGEVDGDLEMELTDNVVLACSGGLRRKCCIKGVNVCLVMLRVVEGHDLSTDLGFECLFKDQHLV